LTFLPCVSGGGGAARIRAATQGARPYDDSGGDAPLTTRRAVSSPRFAEGEERLAAPRDGRQTGPMSPTRLRPVPFALGPVHFVGIGGIGMSAIAEIMLRGGYRVQGSDQKASANTERLQALGATIHIGHAAGNVDGASAVVFSTAVKPDNPEYAEAAARHIPLVRRAEMLAELMRLHFSVAVGGTHGKTTTTSLIAALLDAGGLDPTVINGGIINAYGSNSKMGEGEWMVVEADESDGTFLRLKSTVAVVTNIDPEHLDHYGDFDAVKKAFCDFVENIPFYGFAAVCLDHPEVQALAARVQNRRLVTYGTSPQAEVRAVNIEMGADGACFDCQISPREGEAVTYEKLRLPITGRHNVLNSLAAIAVARELGVDEAAVRKGLAAFGGVKRRFTTTGVAGAVRVIDDYGHHPVEIAAVLKAAREVQGDGGGKVIAVVQPHRYSRLKDLFAEFCGCFNDADSVIVAEVYPAGEQPLEGASRDALVEGLRRFGHPSVIPLDGPAELARTVKAEAQPGDLVVCLGAGDITAWAYALPGQLEALG
jgi:UDP-N-acetylmuramate--alanine ligase